MGEESKKENRMTSSDQVFTCVPSSDARVFLILPFFWKRRMFPVEQTSGFTKKSGGSGCSADVWFCWSRFPTSPSNSNPVLARLWKLTLVVTDVLGHAENRGCNILCSFLFSSNLKICNGCMYLAAITSLGKIVCFYKTKRRSELQLKLKFQ